MIFPSRIFLVGLPGSGKTTVGKFLAKELGYDFMDLDDLVESKSEKSISDIFELEGEIAFRELEAKTLRQITESKLVIATGGGSPCFHDNMTWINRNGFSLFLNTSIDVIVERVSKAAHRPLIGKEARVTVENLFEKRIGYYREAKMESSHIDPCEIMTELRKMFS